jgi:hypothetical protein
MNAMFNEEKDLLLLSCKPILTPTNRNILVPTSPLCFTTLHSMIDLKVLDICYA